ncbi:MAG: hypothetical protein ACJA08_001532 [Cyclobacteriaceae bacterium]|jgi:hypothetical protein
MIRINYTRQITHFFAFMLLQLPLLYKFILFDVAFGFFYIGFILFLPLGLNRTTAMIIALLSGLLIDVFSNTPGIHASACVFIALVRNYWYLASIGDYEDDVNVSWNQLRIWGSLKYLLPMIFMHHLIIFIVENDGLSDFIHLTNKIIMSSLYTFIMVFGISLLIAPRERSS